MPAALPARVVALLCCSVALIAPAAVRAQPPAPDQPYSNRVVASYMDLARSHWLGRQPTCTEADGQTVAAHAVLFDDPDPSVAARAEQPGCRIYLDRDYWPRPFNRLDCTIIVHEWGHLLGFGHSSDPHDLMFEAPVTGAPECDLAASARSAHAKRVRARRAAHARRAAASRRGAKTRARRARRHRVLLRAERRACAARSNYSHCVKRQRRIRKRLERAHHRAAKRAREQRAAKAARPVT